MFLKTFITIYIVSYTINRVLSLTNNVSFVNKLCEYIHITMVAYYNNRT